MTCVYNFLLLKPLLILHKNYFSGKFQKLQSKKLSFELFKADACFTYFFLQNFDFSKICCFTNQQKAFQFFFNECRKEKRKFCQITGFT